jgi:pimeloyl-ACP methyl ester carboxylesterase
MSTLLRALLVFSLAACAAAPRPAYRAQPYRFEPARGAPVAAELGEIEVPEDRDLPASRRIKLRFVRFPATTAQPGSPILYLAGGPGGSGIQSARGARFPVFMAMRAVADVIALDQRGTGISEGKLDCDEHYAAPFDRPLSRAGLAEAIGRAARRCADRLVAAGVALGGYDTVQSAADLDDLRRALGAERMTLWGTSYGTTLALAVLQRNAAHVDRVILAGTEPLDQMLKLPSDQQRLLDEVSILAARDPVLAGRVPDLARSIARLIARLTAQPVKVAIPARAARAPDRGRRSAARPRDARVPAGSHRADRSRRLARPRPPRRRAAHRHGAVDDGARDGLRVGCLAGMAPAHRERSGAQRARRRHQRADARALRAPAGRCAR